MSKKNNFPVNIGMSSILLIFVVLCLASFGILSIVSANADKKLSSKVLNRSIAYYNACNQAENMLKATDKQLHEFYASSNSQEAYESQTELLNTTFTYPISDLQELHITLSYCYPDSSEDSFYHITSWKVVTVQDIDYDEQLHVIP